MPRQTKKTPAQLDREVADILRSSSALSVRSGASDFEGIAEQLSNRDRQALAWLLADKPWKHGARPIRELNRLIELGLLDVTDKEFGETEVTPLGRAVWARIRTGNHHATISDERIAERRKRDPGAYSSRSQLRDIARNAAAVVFAPRKIAPSEAVIQKAKSAAFKAIQRFDPLAGTSDHPAAAYAHGIMDIAMEATEEARQRWEMMRESLRKLRRR